MGKLMVVLASIVAVLQLVGALTEPNCPVIQGIVLVFVIAWFAVVFGIN